MKFPWGHARSPSQNPNPVAKDPKPQTTIAGAKEENIRKQLTDLLTYYLAGAFGCIWLDMIGLVVKLFRDAPPIQLLPQLHLAATCPELAAVFGRFLVGKLRKSSLQSRSLWEQVPQNISVNQNDCFVRTTWTVTQLTQCHGEPSKVNEGPTVKHLIPPPYNNKRQRQSTACFSGHSLSAISQATLGLTSCTISFVTQDDYCCTTNSFFVLGACRSCDLSNVRERARERERLVIADYVYTCHVYSSI